MNQQKVASSRIRLERLHGRGEKVADTLKAAAMVVGGAVTFIGGLRTLLDIASPPPAKESEKD